MESAANLYDEVDGTCVPMVGRETAGRKVEAHRGRLKRVKPKSDVYLQTGVDESGLR